MSRRPLRNRASLASGIAIALVVGVAGCAGTRAVPTVFGTQARIEHYIADGPYEAEFKAVAGRALAYMIARAPRVAKPAIVLDIDETSLSNWPAYRVNGWARITAGPCDLDLERGPCGLRAWQAMGTSKALTPTLELARRAASLNVAVFFITGRPPDLQEATERNLRQEGYQPTGLILLPAGVTFKSAADFKAPERRKIAERGYTILLTMGDQESDLQGGYAERGFKLPNPVYFLP